MLLLSRKQCVPTAQPRARPGRRAARIVAFKSDEEIKDWRVKQMADLARTFYSALWSKGDFSQADILLDSGFVHRDLCSASTWGLAPAAAREARDRSRSGASTPTGMAVGPRAFKALLEEHRSMYPDYWVEVEDLAASDTHRLFVSWVGHGTQMEAATGDSSAAGGGASASLHNNTVRGVDIVTFTLDRSKIQEINVFRQLTTDERHDVEQKLAPNPLEMRLARLHWETPQGKSGRK
ncbi:hypothetical protein HYH03_006623 [Edaphochlamys debaryana]|uniref:SnoaL-like domain-containing protein n=1 Tax=Edaphochlamys debaryana TaxID=47281 RepID=A0A836C1B7_9CHLO|nr:hypothetical protein HYH03_006623 [Edaphochlamys debaryana]|eukprot:KAG2495354.1 hypothetical protein HYH03_006623 [Edaphochlamys debaryana]